MIYMTVEELKDYIKMSKSTIYKGCSNSKIPYIKTGKLLLFKKDAIDLWLQQSTMPTGDQVRNSISNLLKRTKNGN
jgi:excisionase family DNA binding protein